jgi:hypothetical protein
MEEKDAEMINALFEGRIKSNVGEAERPLSTASSVTSTISVWLGKLKTRPEIVFISPLYIYRHRLLII